MTTGGARDRHATVAIDPSGYFCLDPGTANVCFSVLASVFSFFGFGGSHPPPPPNYCYLAGPTGCVGPAPSKFKTIFDDLFGLPGNDGEGTIWAVCKYCLFANEQDGSETKDPSDDREGWEKLRELEKRLNEISEAFDACGKLLESPVCISIQDRFRHEWAENLGSEFATCQSLEPEARPGCFIVAGLNSSDRANQFENDLPTLCGVDQCRVDQMQFWHDAMDKMRQRYRSVLEDLGPKE